MTDDYAASLARDNHRDRDRNVLPDTWPVIGDYRPWDQSARIERHEAEEDRR